MTPFSVPLNTTQHPSGPAELCPRRDAWLWAFIVSLAETKQTPLKSTRFYLFHPTPRYFLSLKMGGNAISGILTCWIFSRPFPTTYLTLYFASLNYWLLTCCLPTPTANWNVSSEREGIFFVKAVSSLGKTILVLVITNNCWINECIWHPPVEKPDIVYTQLSFVFHFHPLGSVGLGILREVGVSDPEHTFNPDNWALSGHFSGLALPKKAISRRKWRTWRSGNLRQARIPVVTGSSLPPKQPTALGERCHFQ